MEHEVRPLKTNQSFDSDAGMMEISLDGSKDTTVPSLAKITEESTVSIGSPTRLTSPLHAQQPSVTSPLARTKSVMRPIKNFDLKLLPFIIKHLGFNELFTLLRVSWSWFKETVPHLYKSPSFSQLSGARLVSFRNTLQSSILTVSGRRGTTLDYISFVQFLHFSNIVFEDPSPLQSWSVVRDVIGLCAMTLAGLKLEVGDESFQDLSPSFVYLHSNLKFSSLRHLAMSSKCMKVPQKLVLELLRSSPIGGLQSLRLSRCLSNFDASGWFLVSERSQDSLHDLILTPTLGPNTLGWEESVFNQGCEMVAKNCINLRRIDLSGHAFPLSNTALEDLMAIPSITEIYFPCAMNDAHLLSLMSKNQCWKGLKVLGLTCMCIDGEIKERVKGDCCNHFTDHLLLEFLESLLEVTGGTVEMLLPAFIVSLKTGKRVDMLKWLELSSFITKRDDKGKFWFKERIILSVPRNRLAIFF